MRGDYLMGVRGSKTSNNVTVQYGGMPGDAPTKAMELERAKRVRKAPSKYASQFETARSSMYTLANWVLPEADIVSNVMFFTAASELAKIFAKIGPGWPITAALHRYKEHRKELLEAAELRKEEAKFDITQKAVDQAKAAEQAKIERGERVSSISASSHQGNVITASYLYGHGVNAAAKKQGLPMNTLLDAYNLGIRLNGGDDSGLGNFEQIFGQDILARINRLQGTVHKLTAATAFVEAVANNKDGRHNRQPVRVTDISAAEPHGLIDGGTKQIIALAVLYKVLNAEQPAGTPQQVPSIKFRTQYQADLFTDVLESPEPDFGQALDALKTHEAKNLHYDSTNRRQVGSITFGNVAGIGNVTAAELDLEEIVAAPMVEQLPPGDLSLH